MDRLHDFTAGWLGGAAAILSTYPLDTIKVRLQAQSTGGGVKPGAWNCLKTTVKNETVLGLYKGMATPLLSVAFLNSLVFGVYANTLHSLTNGTRQNITTSKVIVSGLMAGAVQTLVICPIDIIKIKLQMQLNASNTGTQQLKYKGPVDCARKLYKAKGIQSFYRGLAPTFWRDTPGLACYFTVYEVCCKYLSPDCDRPVKSRIVIISGGVAGTVAWAATYPFDVIKSRMQADGGKHGNFKYSGMMDCVWKSYHKGGLKVFTNGLGVTLLRAFPANASVFYVYTWALKFLREGFGSTMHTKTVNEAL